MTKNTAALLFSFGTLAIAIDACNSGATIGSTSPVPIRSGATATPTAGPGTSPSPGGTASPTPLGTGVATPTATPTVAAASGVYHPPANGDAFSFAGSLSTTYSRPDQFPTPEPTQTAYATIAQDVTVTNPATFAGNASAVDFHDVETDAQTVPAPQTRTNTTDAYFAFSNSITAGNFSELGFTSTLDNGYAVTVVFGSGNGLADILPEAAGAAWTNNASMTSSATSPDGTTVQETVAADGTYAEQFTYPNVNAVTNTGNATASLDGSGTYATQDEGTLNGSPQTYTLSAPSDATSSGVITETTSVAPSPVASGATPTVTTTSIPNWIPTGYLGMALATESDVDNGATTVPAACALPAAFGTSANQLVQTKHRLDPLFGEFETETVTTYDMLAVGPVCTQIADVTTDYYDFTGQSVDTKETVNFEGTPQQVTTISETLALQSETLQSIARRPESARRNATAHFQPRIAMVESRIVAAREIHHLNMLRAMRGGIAARRSSRR